MFESRNSAGVLEKLPSSVKPDVRISSWSYDMEGHAKKHVEGYCELANKTAQQLFKVAAPCIDDHQFKEEELGSVGKLTKVCSQIVLKWMHLARIGRLWYLIVREQICLCYHTVDQSLWQTIFSFDLLHSSYMWIETVLSCGEFRTTKHLRIVSGFWFCGRPWGLEVNFRRCLVYFGSTTFVPVTWMCKKQISVSHSSTVSEIISLEWWITYGWATCSRSLGHCDWSIKFNQQQCQSQPYCHWGTRARPNSKAKTQLVARRQKVEQLSEVDYVPTCTHSSQRESQLYIFEDNESVIKMIVEGEVPRWEILTESPLIGCVIGSIWTQKSKSNMFTPKKQLADTLTRGSFSRDEWNHLLCPFNIMCFDILWTRNGKIGKISAWNLTRVKSKKQVIDEARTADATVHFASLMDICHLKNAELEAQHQKYKGRVVLRGDIVKDDSGSYEVFAEQGSSASQMTAAKIMDIISRLPGCDGQAADAVSAYTQVKMEDAHKLLKNSQIGVSRHLDSSTTTQMAKTMVQYGRPSRSSWR